MLGSNLILLITLSFNFLIFLKIEILTFKKIYDFYEINNQKFWRRLFDYFETMSIHQNSLFDTL
jgi:hypothetical protein